MHAQMERSQCFVSAHHSYQLLSMQGPACTAKVAAPSDGSGSNWEPDATYTMPDSS